MTKKIAIDHVRLKRAYEAPANDDGTRILIDRLWPRGVRKADAAIDEWMKEIAPSTALRKWFGHDPARWQEFRRRYRAEIQQHPDQLGRLRTLAQDGPITQKHAEAVDHPEGDETRGERPEYHEPRPPVIHGVRFSLPYVGGCTRRAAAPARPPSLGPLVACHKRASYARPPSAATRFLAA